ncbi:PREDICTED: carbonic anhydrase 2-like isoform X2 [Polistes canadensis]|uniref:carbonic anhydrase 2-like isoform X2 n=1 Tax=Polistes canadensis TaxID=91411 RepID=UPI000718BDC5|nr:PREDICTED: carbonic anhydrase 2-like isoform X2 [Polistes canadensis]
MMLVVVVIVVVVVVVVVVVGNSSSSVVVMVVCNSVVINNSRKFSYGAQDFSYDGIHGPSHWADDYQSCVGKHQSPINIDEHNVQNIIFPPLVFQRLNVPRTSFITNNGHTVMIQTNNKSDSALVSGGPLGKNTYVFEQLHFHWGENDLKGSEDYINNHTFAMELHAVFYKQEYNSMAAAVNHSDGLAVFAYFYEADDKENPTYNAIVEALSDVEMVNSKHELEEPLLLEHLLQPNNSTIANYFTYNGSLTTPPCFEVVTWIDFKDPQLLSHEQLAAFRNLRTSEGKKLTHNFRPVQPLFDRLVYHNILENKDNSQNGQLSIHNKVTMLIIFFVSMLLITI